MTLPAPGGSGRGKTETGARKGSRRGLLLLLYLLIVTLCGLVALILKFSTGH